MDYQPIKVRYFHELRKGGRFSVDGEDFIKLNLNYLVIQDEINIYANAVRLSDGALVKTILNTEIQTDEYLLDCSTKEA
jgi:hypothetical protein